MVVKKSEHIRSSVGVFWVKEECVVHHDGKNRSSECENGLLLKIGRYTAVPLREH